MAQPIHVDIPHQLGREEARRRIAGNIHQLQGYIPGGAQVAHNWVGDRLDMEIGAMGQTVNAQIGVEESVVRVNVVLPGLLGMLAKPIEAALKAKGSTLLLDDNSKDKG
jgi:Putative polyhydroxyalkanoic acid system protein (PHA_gran_rgn)